MAPLWLSKSPCPTALHVRIDAQVAVVKNEKFRKKSIILKLYMQKGMLFDKNCKAGMIFRTAESGFLE